MDGVGFISVLGPKVSGPVLWMLGFRLHGSVRSKKLSPYALSRQVGEFLVKSR